MSDKCLCRQDEDGGIDILKAEIDMGELGTIESGLNFYTYQDIRKMFLYNWHKYDERNGNSVGKTIEPSVQINYCPFCGRDLRKLDDD